MTKEELKKEAIQYAVDYPTSYGKGYKHKDLRIAYLVGAEPREKRIAELEAQIEKMRCCENCYYHRFWGNELGCKLDSETEFECLKTKSKWRLWEE